MNFFKTNVNEFNPSDSLLFDGAVNMKKMVTNCVSTSMSNVLLQWGACFVTFSVINQILLL